MITPYFVLFAAVSISLVIAAFVRSEKFFEYPYFMAATFAAFILPQAYGLLGRAVCWPPEALANTFLMCFLSVCACWLGYKVGPNPRLLRRLDLTLNSGRILHGGILFVLIGFYFNHLTAQLPAEAKGVLSTGVVTIYMFFASTIYLGFAICFNHAMRWGGWPAWLFTAVAAVIPLEAAMFYGRREPTVLFIFSVALVLYFVKGKRPSRWVALGCVVAAALLVPVTEQYRQLVGVKSPSQALGELQLLGSFDQFSDPDAIMELKNAMFVIAATQYTGNYRLGASYWDQIVFRFVPAQLVGLELKNSLTIDGQANVGNLLAENTFEGAAYKFPLGSTVTGIGDAYWQFGLFGCLFFAAVGAFFKNLWSAASNAHIFAAQLLYIPLITSAMRSVTNWSVDFLPGAVYSSMFVGLVLVYARERTSEQTEAASLYPDIRTADNQPGTIFSPWK